MWSNGSAVVREGSTLGPARETDRRTMPASFESWLTKRIVSIMASRSSTWVNKRAFGSRNFMVSMEHRG